MGWTQESFYELQCEYPKYESWRKSEIFWIPYPLEVPVVVTPSRTICFTGFRDKELETRLKALNFDVVSSVTRALHTLIIPDGEDAVVSEKVKKAASYGTVAIMKRSEFVNKYLPND